MLIIAQLRNRISVCLMTRSTRQLDRFLIVFPDRRIVIGAEFRPRVEVSIGLVGNQEAISSEVFVHDIAELYLWEMR